MEGGTAGGPIVNIVGELVALGPARRDLVPFLYRWDNDLLRQRSQGGAPIPWTLDSEYAAYDADQGSVRQIPFAIYRRADWRAIGFTAWKDIDYRHGTASFIIGIGEADCRGRGYGTETTRLMLDYAFSILGLHGVVLTVYAFNRAAIRAYEKAGFRECGRRREGFWMGGQRWDVIYMDCLSGEFSGTRQA